MKGYTTIKDTVQETVIKKSRFIAYAYTLTSEEDAEEKIAYLRKKHYDATHVCYAYISDEEGRRGRYSDDGEPSGTAGQPMFDALKNSGITKCLVAVVRYFGGILLGAGGLVRAYSSSVSEVLQLAEKVTYEVKEFYSVEFPFSLYKKIQTGLNRLGIVTKIEYGMAVFVQIASEVGSNFRNELNNLCATQMDILYEGEGFNTGGKQ